MDSPSSLNCMSPLPASPPGTSPHLSPFTPRRRAISMNVRSPAKKLSVCQSHDLPSTLERFRIRLEGYDSLTIVATLLGSALELSASNGCLFYRLSGVLSIGVAIIIACQSFYARKILVDVQSLRCAQTFVVEGRTRVNNCQRILVASVFFAFLGTVLQTVDDANLAGVQNFTNNSITPMAYLIVVSIWGFYIASSLFSFYDTYHKLESEFETVPSFDLVLHGGLMSENQILPV